MSLRLYPFFELFYSLVPLWGLGAYVIFNLINRSVFHIIYRGLLAGIKDTSKSSLIDIEKGD